MSDIDTLSKTLDKQDATQKVKHKSKTQCPTSTCIFVILWHFIAN